MKKTFLTFSFFLAHVSLPFIIVDCGGADMPYDRTQITDNSANSPDCANQVFLTCECTNPPSCPQDQAGKTSKALSQNDEEEEFL